MTYLCTTTNENNAIPKKPEKTKSPKTLFFVNFDNFVIFVIK